MFTCPECHGDTVWIGREDTVRKTFIVSDIHPDGAYEEVAPGCLVTTITTGPWKKATCAQCDAPLDIATVFPAQAAPVPTYVYIVTYGHQHGTEAKAYATEAGARAAVEDLKAEYPDEFNEDDPRSWCEVSQLVVY